MSLQWTEGFELRNTDNELSEAYPGAVTNSVSYPSGRLIPGTALSASSSNTFQLGTPALEQDDTWIVGIALELNKANANEPALIGIYDGTTPQVTAYIAPTTGDDYQIDIYRGDNATGTLLGSSSNQPGAVGYNYWELKVVIASSGGTWELRKNGVIETSGTGNTQNTGNAFANRIFFEGRKGGTASVGTSQFLVDDIYVCNGTGTSRNDFLGDQVVEGLRPSAPGDETDWISEASGSPSGTANWDQVNDTGVGDDTGYVVSDTAFDKDLYNFQNLSYITGNINGVMVHVRPRLEAGGTRNLGILFKDPVNGETDIGAALTVNVATYQDRFVVVEDHPVTAAPFTVTNINDGQWGFELKS